MMARTKSIPLGAALGIGVMISPAFAQGQSVCRVETSDISNLAASIATIEREAVLLSNRIEFLKAQTDMAGVNEVADDLEGDRRRIADAASEAHALWEKMRGTCGPA